MITIAMTNDVPMRRIVYAVPADLRSGAAHAVHVVKMGYALSQLREGTCIVVSDAPEAREIGRLFGLPSGLEVICTECKGKSFASIRFARSVLTLLRLSSDSVLTRNLMTACVTAAMSVPTILELHSPLATWKERLLFRLFQASPGMLGFIAITQALAARFLQDFGPSLAPRLHVLPDAADARHQGQRCHNQDGIPLVGYIGSFLPGKGVELVLRIATLMPEVRFELVGGTADDLPGHIVPPNVVFAGRLPHAAAMERLDMHDVVLLPNQKQVLVSGGKLDIGAWTSPLKLFEYMAAGKPIVASRLPVLMEILEDGHNCLLADCGATEEWVARIGRLLANPTAASALGDIARRDFLMSYTWPIRAGKVIRIFEEGRSA